MLHVNIQLSGITLLLQCYSTYCFHHKPLPSPEMQGGPIKTKIIAGNYLQQQIVYCKWHKHLCEERQGDIQSTRLLPERNLKIGCSNLF